MKYYALIQNNKIIGKGQCPCSADGLICFEITEEVYNELKKYIWNGSDVVLNPDWEQQETERERDRINMLSLTKREVFLALYKDKGITPDQLKAQITDPEVLIEFEYANDYYRGNPLIDAIGQSLGYTSQQMDELFINKEFRHDSVV
jgi:hypothetical protein